MPSLSNAQLLARGAPFLLFIVGGSVFLGRFTSGTVAARDLKTKSRTEKAYKIEEEHARIAKKLYGGDGQPGDVLNKPIPRPK